MLTFRGAYLSAEEISLPDSIEKISTRDGLSQRSTELLARIDIVAESVLSNVPEHVRPHVQATMAKKISNINATINQYYSADYANNVLQAQLLQLEREIEPIKFRTFPSEQGLSDYLRQVELLTRSLGVDSESETNRSTMQGRVKSQVLSFFHNGLLPTFGHPLNPKNVSEIKSIIENLEGTTDKIQQALESHDIEAIKSAEKEAKESFQTIRELASSTMPRPTDAELASIEQWTRENADEQSNLFLAMQESEPAEIAAAEQARDQRSIEKSVSRNTGTRNGEVDNAHFARRAGERMIDSNRPPIVHSEPQIAPELSDVNQVSQRRFLGLWSTLLAIGIFGLSCSVFYVVRRR